MGLPAPPPPPPFSTRQASSNASAKRRSDIPDWQKDPHGWIDYNDLRSTARVICVLQNLTNRPALNGTTGLVVGYDPGICRYHIQLCAAHKEEEHHRVPVVSLLIKAENVRLASVSQQWRGKLQLLQNQRRLIHKDARAWLRRIVPLGILAGNRGPTDAQLDGLLVWLVGTAVVLLVFVVGWLVYQMGFSKACMLATLIMSLAVVLGPEMLYCRTNEASSTWHQRCGRRLAQLAEDLCGQPVSPKGVLTMTALWLTFTAWVFFMT